MIPYGIKISNTKTKERVVIELEFGGAEALYTYLAFIVHQWAVNGGNKPKAELSSEQMKVFHDYLKIMVEKINDLADYIEPSL